MIGDHLTFRQVQDYVAKNLPVTQIPAFHEHIEDCPACRELLTSTAIGTGTDHLTEREAVDYVTGSLPTDETSRCAAHLAVCVPCAEMVLDLEEFRASDQGVADRMPEQMPATPARSRWQSVAWALPLAATVLLVAGVSVWFGLRAGHSEPRVVAELRDAGGMVRLNERGALLTNSALPPDASELVAAALRTGRLPETPPALPTDPKETLRSSGGAASHPIVEGFAPDGIRVVSDRPEFHWSPVDGATAYRITVTDEDLNEVAHSGPLRNSAWTPETALPRSRPLLWQVAVLRQGDWRTAPSPPETSPRFEIVSESTARRIAAAQSGTPPSHLLLAIVYSQAGMNKEAASEADTLVTLNPGSVIAASLRKSLGAIP